MRKIYLQNLTREKLGMVEENKQVKEIALDRPEQRPLTGNIYLGKIINVEKGLQAAFVSYGADKKGFLVKKELPQAREDIKKPIESLVTEGEQILIQVIKEPYQTKGAVLTANITLPGIHLVYLPFGGYVASSRKLDQEKSTVLKSRLASLAEDKEGAIIRTSAAEVPPDLIDSEFDQLRKSWQELKKTSQNNKAPSLIFEDRLIPDRLLRKYASSGIDSVICDDSSMAVSIRKNFPTLKDQVVWKKRWEEEVPTGIYQLLENTMNPYVSVPGGAEIVIEQTEAMVVIDINSGSYVRKTTKNDTSLQVNLAAIPVIVDEIRLRNLSGMVVIDFITMKSESDRKKVMAVLKKELNKDLVRTELYGFTALGLFELTRKRELPSIPSILGEKKKSRSATLSVRTIAYQLERELIFRQEHGSESLLVDIHPAVFEVFQSILSESRLVERNSQTVYSRITREIKGYMFRMEGTNELVQSFIQSKTDEDIDKLF